MNFEKDIFISYAHLDEKEMTMDEMGWITAFHKNLEKQVGDYLGEKPVIWRDSQLQGNDRFDEEIVGQFPKLRVMVSVISPRYVKSDWCLKEVDGFYDVANKNLGFYVGNKGRIFKVIKTPVPLEKIPDKIKPMLEYPFFTKEADDDTPYEYGYEKGDAYLQDYWKAICKLSYQVCKLIQEINAVKDGEPIQVKRKVYLAETTSDLKSERESIYNELNAGPYEVFPSKLLNKDDAESYINDVKEEMKNCSFSIHLIGSKYGTTPDGTEKSTVILQEEIATEQSKTSALQRLFWIKKDENADQKIAQFISTINQDESFHVNDDLLNGTIEEFKTELIKKLKAAVEADKALAEPKRKQNNLPLL